MVQTKQKNLVIRGHKCNETKTEINSCRKCLNDLLLYVGISVANVSLSAVVKELLLGVFRAAVVFVSMEMLALIIAELLGPVPKRGPAEEK